MYNIIISAGWYPSNVSSLNAIFTKKHVDVIAKNNSVVVVYCVKNDFQNESFLIENYDENFPVYICYYKGAKGLFAKIINITRYFIGSYRLIKAAKKTLKSVDFFHVHVLTRAAIIPYFYKLFKKIPFFISEHSTIYIRKEPISYLKNKLMVFLAKESNGLSAVSESLKFAMKAEGLHHKNFMVIANVVDDKIFSLKPDTIQNKIKFLHVSRLDEKAKNTIGILRTFDKINLQYPDTEIHIVGGFENEISKAEIFREQMKSKEAVFFHGVKFGEAIVPFYHQADYFIMFSNYETQAVVIVEALMCGLPVIATFLPALNEYLHERNSFQVVIGDEEMLFKKMELCLKNQYNFWSKEQIRADIKHKFDLKNIESRFQDFYKAGLSG